MVKAPEELKNCVKGVGCNRYKFVCMVYLGLLQSQGMAITSHYLLNERFTGILLPVIGICRCMVVCCGLNIWRVLWVVLSWRFTGQLEAGMFGFRIIGFWNRVYPCFFPNQWNIVFPCAVIYYFGYWASNYFSNHFQKFDRNLNRASGGVTSQIF